MRGVKADKGLLFSPGYDGLHGPNENLEPYIFYLLRLLFSEMAEETLLAGQRILPRALDRAGFEFLYPDLESALREILR